MCFDLFLSRLCVFLLLTLGLFSFLYDYKRYWTREKYLFIEYRGMSLPTESVFFGIIGQDLPRYDIEQPLVGFTSVRRRSVSYR